MKTIATISIVLLTITGAQAQHVLAYRKHATHKQTASAAPRAQGTLPRAFVQMQPFTPSVGRDTPFPDVPKDHWAYQAVETLRTTRIMRGYPTATPSAK